MGAGIGGGGANPGMGTGVGMWAPDGVVALSWGSVKALITGSSRAGSGPDVPPGGGVCSLTNLSYHWIKFGLSLPAKLAGPGISPH
ncbi:MAG: hypothetical protein DBX96_07640 [Propionibacterium sp.]|nr:MAG: hypothetical protein DBX96_07640 [Propionibacterium sp.]